MRTVGKYYPVFLNVQSKHCLVVGGGRVAERKVRMLLNAGGRVTVWSPRITTGLMTLAKRGALAYKPEPYTKRSLSKYQIVIAATDDPKAQEAISAAGRKEGVLVNIADRPELSDFIAPSVLSRGDLTIAISTGGASPAMAKRIRQQLEALFGREYALALKILFRLRARLSSKVETARERQGLLRAIVDSRFVDCVKRGNLRDVDRILTKVCGRGFTLKELGIRVRR